MFNKQKFFTTIKNSTLNPKWDEIFYFEVDDISFPIKISMFDQDSGIAPVPGKDDLLGSITLSLTDLEIDMSGKGIPLKSWYILKRKPKRPTYKATPKLRVEVAYELKKNLTETLQDNSSATETVKPKSSLHNSSGSSSSASSSTPLSNSAGNSPSAPAGSIFGFKRGKCKSDGCDCTFYQPENERGGQCQNCGHWPAQHTNLGVDEANTNSNGGGITNSSASNPSLSGSLDEDEPETKPETVNDIQSRFATTNVIISHTWEVDATELKFTKRLGEGTSAKVFRGTYRGQDVAIKVLKDKAEAKVLEEFKKEFEIMRFFSSASFYFS